MLFPLSILILNLGHITKPPNMLLGNLPCNMSFKLLLLTILGNLPLSLQERKLLVVNGYIKSNTILMALLSATKLELLPKGLTQLEGLDFLDTFAPVGGHVYLFMEITMKKCIIDIKLVANGTPNFLLFFYQIITLFLLLITLFFLNIIMINSLLFLFMLMTCS